jgi:hypothetical protein
MQTQTAEKKPGGLSGHSVIKRVLFITALRIRTTKQGSMVIYKQASDFGAN